MSSAWRTYRKAHTTTRNLVEGVGEKMVRRHQEKEILRAAIKNEDWVTRDEIMIERIGRREGLIMKILFWPTFLTLFWGLAAFGAALGLWAWRFYCTKQKIGELMADIPHEAATAFATLRGAVTAALVTVLALLIVTPNMFWATVIGGWTTTLMIGSVALMKIHAYFASMQVEGQRAFVEEMEEPAEATDEEILEEAIHRVEERKIDEAMDRLEDMLTTNVVYGLTKPIPHVFDVPAAFPAGIEHNNKERFRHTYVIGKTGSGKSIFLRNVILQDIKKGVGVVLLTHEKTMFRDYVLPYYPSERIDDLIYFNPSDTKGKIIGFNLFALNKGEDPIFKAGELWNVFERTLDDLGASMKPILQNAITALVTLQSGKSLRDLEKLIDPSIPVIRSEISRSDKVPDRTKRFWAEYEDSATARTGFQPLLNRLGPLIDEPLITTLSHGSFNVSEELNYNRRVVCVDLSDLRGDRQRMVGQLIIALLRETFYARDVQIPDKNFLNYFWYIDEFQQYASQSEQALLEVFNGLRKFNVGLTIAHQTTENLSRGLLRTILGNVGTIGCMRLQEFEANDFAKELRVYERRTAPTKKKETIADVRAKYREIYEGNHPQKESILRTLQTRINRLEQEAALHENEEEPERDPTMKLRPDLFDEENMEEGQIILRGATTTQQFKRGAVLIQVPFEPLTVEKEDIFDYEDYVINSQEKYGKEISPPPPPDSLPDTGTK